MKYLLTLFILFYTSFVHAQATTTGTNDDYYATSSTTDVLDGLVLHVPLRHRGLSYAQDVSSYKVQGTITGAIWGTETAGLYFDGVDDYVSFGDPADGHLDFGTTSSFSFSCFVYPVSYIGTTDSPMYKGGINAINGYCFRIGTGTSWVAQITQGTGTVKSATLLTSESTATYLDKRTLLVGVVDRSNQNLLAFLDGVQTGTTSIAVGSGTCVTTIQLSIGGTTAGTRDFEGYIEDVRIYNRALSSQEVSNIYNAAPASLK